MASRDALTATNIATMALGIRRLTVTTCFVSVLVCCTPSAPAFPMGTVLRSIRRSSNVSCLRSSESASSASDSSRERLRLLPFLMAVSIGSIPAAYRGSFPFPYR